MIIRSPEPEVKILVDRDHIKTSFKEWARPGHFSRTIAKGHETATWIWNQHADAHNFNSHSSDLKEISQKVFKYSDLSCLDLGNTKRLIFDLQILWGLRGRTSELERDEEQSSRSEGSMIGTHGTKSVESNPPVNLSGTAKDAKNAPPLGLVDIGESQRAYIFRVSLPGVCKPQCNVKLDIRVDGQVEIKGVNQDSEFINNHANEKYKPKVQQLSPSRTFNISFNLPGRVDPRLVAPTFRNTGILEVVVMKHTIPYKSTQ
ncbi:hypothetical protein L1987_23838 [Smallanthus sonchifolius]|uniref:Uncharacterized protein n=1 Tax=Smallanthus sonchifolius TaxID=185202 RepID=A0ACB9IJD9_9ASTR|nr:hypothetical protein L1987_23838 [Smallanthus sonchifolius]